jgi:hypothetical protein
MPITMMVFAEVAKLVDALASGASGGNPMEVQVLSSAPQLGLIFSNLSYYEFFINQSNGWRSTIVSFRSGPVEMISIGISVISSIRFI